MDEYFECFLDEFGPPSCRQDAPLSSIERYQGRLPEALLAYWAEHGWSAYADGLFWTVNPQDYEPVLEAWIGETALMERDAYYLIARTAFGHLLLWGERTGFTLQIFAPGSYGVLQRQGYPWDERERAVRSFFAAMERQAFDFEGLFLPARNKLGPLQHDEMYGFVPALALGGAATLSHLKKVKAVEHLVLLAQLAPLQVLNAQSA